METPNVPLPFVNLTSIYTYVSKIAGVESAHVSRAISLATFVPRDANCVCLPTKEIARGAIYLRLLRRCNSAGGPFGDEPLRTGSRRVERFCGKSRHILVAMAFSGQSF